MDEEPIQFEEYDRRDVVQMLTDYMNDERLNQKEIAEEIGISEQYLSDILKLKRDPGKKVLDFFGLVKRVTYVERRRYG